MATMPPALVSPDLALLQATNPAAHTASHWAILAVFATVYLGMFLGGLPRLKLDRSGVALLGAIAMIALTGQSVQDAARTVDLPTIVLLFSFMVVAAQLRLGGFYAAVARRVGDMHLSAAGLLAALIASAAALSAVFSNDVICLAMTPVVVQLCLQRGHPPLPFLLGLACAANIGSAATLIGNPQNMLIGSMLHLHFADYARQALVPVVLSLLVLWLWLVKGPGLGLVARQRAPEGECAAKCSAQVKEEPAQRAGDTEQSALPHIPCPSQDPTSTPTETLDLLQTAKGLLVATVLMLIFLFTNWPREIAALVGAGVLLLSRRLHSADVMGFVDWPLLILFMGLFVVNHAFASTGMATQAVTWLAMQGVSLRDTGALLLVSAALSNLVSNVPAVMLLLPHVQPGPQAGVTLALVTTLAGNLLLVGSIANLIVVDIARKSGIAIDWRQHAKVGVPVTILTLGIVWLSVA
jgi:Na+/H+ antiporter NhaD/arsenite permease-like protein